MHTTTLLHAARAAVVLATVAAAGCSLEKQGAPALSGPSEFGRSVTLLATPDRLTQDGVSTSTIRATMLDEAGRPISAAPIQWNVTASDGRTFVQPSSNITHTDSNGATTITVTAPPAPAALPSTPLRLTISATPYGSNSANAAAREVEVTLVPPAGTLPANNNPVASFTITPTTAMIQQTVTVDASATTDEGITCGDACTYAWDFGDGGTDGGRIETHAYAAAGTYTIRLTVTDARGGVHSTTNTIVITAPAIAASFTVSPTAPVEGAAINFDASGSTIGTGATIVEYTWVWGDGTPNTVTTSPQTSHTYTGLTANTTFVVRLTIRDSLGRTATITSNVTVTNVP